MEPYEVLTGAMPTDPQQIRALVEALRRRRKMGEVGMLTGDRVMAPFGKNMTSQADQYATDAQDIRQKDTDNAQTKFYQGGQLDHMAQVLKETIANNLRQDATTRRGQDLDLEEAKYRSDHAAPGKSPRLRATDINNLRQNAQAESAVSGMLDFMKKGGKLGAVGNIPIVGSVLRQSANYAASKGAGTQGTKDTAMQWQNYKRWYELAQRNALFGATLTPNEMRAWSQANPSSAQTDEQIGEGLKIMQKIYAHNRKSVTEGLLSEGFSPEAISSYSSLSTSNADKDIPEDFDMEAAQNFLMENPETLPQFQEMLKDMGLDPMIYTPAME